MAVPSFQLLRTKSMILCLALWEANNIHDSAFFCTSQIFYFITSKTWALIGTFAAIPLPIVSHQDDWNSLRRVSMLVISTEQPMILFKHKSGLSILLLKNLQWLPISESESSQCQQDSAHQPPYHVTSSPTSSQLPPFQFNASLAVPQTGRTQPQGFVTVPSAGILLLHIWSASFRSLFKCHLIRKDFFEHSIFYSTSLSLWFLILLPHFFFFFNSIALINLDCRVYSLIYVYLSPCN